MKEITLKFKPNYVLCAIFLFLSIAGINKLIIGISLNSSDLIGAVICSIGGVLLFITTLSSFKKTITIVNNDGYLDINIKTLLGKKHITIKLDAIERVWIINKRFNFVTVASAFEYTLLEYEHSRTMFSITGISGSISSNDTKSYFEFLYASNPKIKFGYDGKFNWGLWWD